MSLLPICLLIRVFSFYVEIRLSHSGYVCSFPEHLWGWGEWNKGYLDDLTKTVAMYIGIRNTSKALQRNQSSDLHET